MLTIAYMTNRKDCRFEWFADSLRRQITQETPKIRVVVVDLWQREKTLANRLDDAAIRLLDVVEAVDMTPPKPTVWQGPTRLTKEDWFAAASSRNTALCLAQDGYLAYVDDLSVLLPGWLNAVVESMTLSRVVCGSYKKVKNLVVEDGVVTNCDEYPGGVDNRLSHASADVSLCAGNWLYGCSVGAPVETFLSVGGWPEFCDGLGFEDCIMGMALANAGHRLHYDRRMMTYESEELHAQPPTMRKEDWHFVDGNPVIGGNGGSDKSHAVLKMVQNGCKYFENYYAGGIRQLRADVLAGKPFPTDQNPQHDWFTRLPLSSL